MDAPYHARISLAVGLRQVGSMQARRPSVGGFGGNRFLVVNMVPHAMQLGYGSFVTVDCCELLRDGALYTGSNRNKKIEV